VAKSIVVADDKHGSKKPKDAHTLPSGSVLRLVYSGSSEAIEPSNTSDRAATEIPTHPIKAALTAFLNDLESIYSSAPTSLLAIGFVQGLAKHNLYKVADVAGLRDTEEDQVIDRNTVMRLHRARIRIEVADRAALIAPRTFLVSMVSQFDVFLARLIRALVQYRPDILSTSERKLSYAEMLSFSSVESARESILEAEIESVLRKNLSEQFAWFESKFEVKLRTELPAWTELVELTQRRNLFVHADGIVNKQYLSVCELNGSKVPNYSVGEPLHVDPTYLLRVRDVLLEVSIKLSQVLWRKADTSTLEEADTHLNTLAYEALQGLRYDIAINLFDFAFLKPMKRGSKELELMLVVNRANAYKLSGDSARCAEIMGTEDWSAYDKQFRLARAVLLGKQIEMIRLMKEIGTSGSPSIHSYREWPLFASVRSNSAFIEAFKGIFCEDFIIVPPIDVDASAREESPNPGLDAKKLAQTMAGLFGEGEMKGWLGEFLKVMKTHN
jgi:hypothetical protein